MNMCGSVEVDANLKKDEGQSIVCSADGFTMWSDFPKGLKVLLLDHDGISAAEIKSKLEGMDYLVSLFYNEDEALEAVSNKMESFHVAIVEVNTSNSHENFRFLQMARDLPTIMISNVHCLNTMMKCIALGAAEFLQKPLSEDKLRNIWQHVVHKAFNAGENALSKSLKPIKETVVSMLHTQSDTGTSLTENQKQTEATNVQELTEEKAHDDPEANDRFPEPSTPQLEQGVRQEDSGDGQDRTNSSMEQEEREHVKENVEQMLSCSESKSVDNTCNNNSTVEVVPMEEVPSSSGEAAAEEEVNSASGTKTDEDSDPKECIIPSSESKDGVKVESSAGDPIKKNASIHRSSCSNSSKASKKKMTVSKVDWTSELHRRFVQAVEQLGIDQAIPSKILELMKVEGLTRHNVASHLQKYRLHKRHVLPKDEERRWPPYRDPMSRVYAHKPIVAFPHVWSNYGFPPNHAYPVWGHPSSIPMWGYNSYQTWRPSHGSWPWKSYTRMYADAWGCPESPFSSHTYQNWPPNHSFDGLEYHKREPRNLYDCHLGEEVVDKVVKEAINKPWLPLPLGLKPPSIDTVLAELHRQGIRSIPPPS